MGGSGLDLLRFLDDFSSFLAYFGHVFGCSCWGGYAPAPPLGMFKAAFIIFGMIFELLGLLWACFRLLLLGRLRGMFSVALAGGLSMLFCTYAARIRKLAKDEKPNKD